MTTEKTETVAVGSDAMVRLPYDRFLYIYPSDTLIVKKRGGGERRVPPSKWWINKNTPVGDEADLWELMPYDGRRYLSWNSLIAVERNEPNQ